jgi:hypothetical protein
MTLLKIKVGSLIVLAAQMFPASTVAQDASATLQVRPKAGDHSAERERLKNSPLAATAREAGGLQLLSHQIDSTKLKGSLAAMFDASDVVVLAHIESAVGSLAPAGTEPIMSYKAVVIKGWKGHQQNEVTFSQPGGMVSLEPGVKAISRIPGVGLLRPGSRCVLFLRFARGKEREIAPALTLTGEGVQGAFTLDGGVVKPIMMRDTVGATYRLTPESQLLGDIDATAKEARHDH